MVDVYILADNYYQKLGEVWDHEVKDFKVLYKPLYACDVKPGSFEAHYLAVSTFERWSLKFVQLSLADINELPAEVSCRIVSTQALRELASGWLSYPQHTTHLPPGIMGHRARVVIESDPAITLHSTESGYGTRSHKRYHTIDFAAQFESVILEGKKVATTRVTNTTAVGSEPHLNNLVQHMLNNSGENTTVRATTTDSTTGVSRVFAKLEITEIEIKKFGDLSIELAAMELFDSIAELQNCLLSFYPSLLPTDKVVVFYFRLII